MRVVGLIPVRMKSTRLPGKALKDVLGLPAIVHVYKRCALANNLDELYVVTDSEEIKQQVQKHGGKVLISGKHRNGSERIHEVSKDLDCSHIINIQGDEVLVDPKHIDQIVSKFVSNSDLKFIVGVTPYNETGLKQDFKAVLSNNKNLIYCSREDIPSSVIFSDNNRLKVVFIFGFTKSSLETFVNWNETENELREPNEFLRILDNDEKIKTVLLDKAFTSLDTPKDLKKIREIMKGDSYFPNYKST
jgi:3-deoxy-manno-octulosonate cytidylyltransferase (CMP-KDO synthetase)